MLTAVTSGFARVGDESGRYLILRIRLGPPYCGVDVGKRENGPSFPASSGIVPCFGFSWRIKAVSIHKSLPEKLTRVEDC